MGGHMAMLARPQSATWLVQTSGYQRGQRRYQQLYL